jgi:hypothetical protein
MYVRMVSFGSNWWAARSGDTDDPLCFRRRAAYFNAAALISGRRLRHSAIFPGQIRFNAKSGFNPEFASRAIGKTFLCSEPHEFDGKMHLLVQRPATGMKPDSHLANLNTADHGAIRFHIPGWKSNGVRPISISLRGSRYEAMFLLGLEDWVESDLGRWRVDPSRCGLLLSDAHEEDRL